MHLRLLLPLFFWPNVAWSCYQLLNISRSSKLAGATVDWIAYSQMNGSNSSIYWWSKLIPFKMKFVSWNHPLKQYNPKGNSKSKKKKKSNLEVIICRTCTDNKVCTPKITLRVKNIKIRVIQMLLHVYDLLLIQSTRFVKWLPNSIRSYKEPYDYIPLPSSNFRSTPYLIERRL